MSVDLVLALTGAAFSTAVLGFVAWAFTRPPDRIQLASVALAFSAFLCVGVAADFYGQGPAATGSALAAGFCAALLYVTTGALAIFHQQWAWRGAIAAFAVQIVLGLIVPFTPVAFAKGKVGPAISAVCVLAGALGLWACLHAGSRRRVFGDDAGADQPPAGLSS